MRNYLLLFILLFLTGTLSSTDGVANTRGLPHKVALNDLDMEIADVKYVQAGILSENDSDRVSSGFNEKVYPEEDSFILEQVTEYIDYISYVFRSDMRGKRELYMEWFQNGPLCSEIPVEIYSGDFLLETRWIDTAGKRSGINGFGSWTFDGPIRVIVYKEHGCGIIPVTVFSACYRDVVLDAGGIATRISGKWDTIIDPKSQNGGFMFTSEPGAEIRFEGRGPGYQKIALSWPDRPNMWGDISVEIYDGETLLEVIFINQKSEGVSWKTIGAWEFYEKPILTLISQGSGIACSDAVRFSK